MDKSIQALSHALARIRTGRAHPSLLADIKVPYYGTDTPLAQVANVMVEDARTLLISPWEKSLIPDVERAILKSDLGLNPKSGGETIRIPLPPLTEESRRALTKIARHEAENAKVAIRNIRREANSDLKELARDKDISEDDERRGVELVQQLTDAKIAEVDVMLQHKEKDLMEI